MSELDLDALFDGMPAAATAPVEFYTDLPWYPDLVACEACPCRKEARQVVPGAGALDARLMVLGRNPGGEEDRNGHAFIGKAGGELDTWLGHLKVVRDRILVSNVVKCHTAEDRPPTQREVTVCATRWLSQELASYPQVRIMLALGDQAARFVLGVHAPSMSKLAFAPMRVELEATPGRTITVVPLPHPAYVLRKPAIRTSIVDLLGRAAEYLTTHEPDALRHARGGL